MTLVLYRFHLQYPIHRLPVDDIAIYDSTAQQKVCVVIMAFVSSC
jgi:hypothetical protein